MSEPRAYESPLREQQRAETRERILHAAIDLLAEHGEPTVPDVAKRAGVATRTVYFHFDSKAGLMDALSELLDAEIGIETFPDVDEFIDFSNALWESILENEKIWRVLNSTRAGGDVRDRGRTRRFASFMGSLEDRLVGLEATDRELVAVVLYMQFAVGTRFGLLDRFGLTGEQAVRGSAWAIRTLLAELERNPEGPIE